MLLACVVAAAAAADVSVEATRDGDAVEVEAVAEIAVGVARAWEVLTDYNRLAEFVPDLHESRVVSRKGDNAVVEQKGAARFLFFSYPIEVRLAVTEHPRQRIESRAVAGNFRELRSVYTLEPREGGVRLRYHGRLVPDFQLPLFHTYVLKSNVEATFRAMVEEIERDPKRPKAGDP
ncbi:MAG TPA: SRPBCC family protein [Burkholderiales bacterium]|nr:SRPBCC family protein [Burkholderiales bacterium]